jgi:hypothetical protein
MQQQQAARTAGSPQLRQLPEQQWQHNKLSGTFFSKHLKQSDSYGWDMLGSM